jgi:hypothetical protein
MLALEQGVEVQAQRELDRFARRARGRDHDDPAARMRGRGGRLQDRGGR